jgi:hypothetical protein
MANSTERLKTLVGFDPAQRPKVTDDIFKEVMQDINEERAAIAKDKARTLLTQAFELREQMVKARSDFERQEKKFEKELGKILNRLESELRGSPPAEEAEETDAEG